MNISQKYMFLIDDMREQKGFSQFEFSKNICNERTYRRYLSGDVDVPQNKLNLFCEKLAIRPSEFYYMVNANELAENKDLFTAFTLLNEKKSKEAKDLLEGYKNYKFLASRNKIFYDYCLDTYDFQLGVYKEDTMIKRLSKLINYNDWKNKKTFDFIEIIVLSDIAYYEAEIGKEDTLPLLYSMLENDDWIYISSRSRDVIPALYFRVTQLLSMKEKFDEVLRLAEKGIKLSFYVGNTASVASILYFQGLANYKTGNIDLGFESFKRSYAYVLSTGNEYEIKTYKEIYKKHFNLDIYELFKE